MTRWNYANDHGLDYPVQRGDRWTVAGHEFLCHDLEAASQWPAVVAERRPALAYTDPPWNAGNARSFRTKAGVDGEFGRQVDMNNLLKAILSPLRDLGLLAYVETGKRDEKALSTLITGLGGTVTGRWGITYYGRKPAVLVAADFRPTPNEIHPDLNGLDDDDTPGAVFAFHLAHGLLREGDVVVDPCAGRGLTAASAHCRGLRSLNNELHPNRVSSALAKIVDLSNLQPERQS